ncbi:hypothetical protein [Actinokineospora terrae]|uniref:Uncharacterized protein n=1 Tax=Actinokineospora terrae TaxID=155974 RepID=A0A1H9XN51_9PSEU|nr:hypothetical protein [Actinokineospora terrae]SES47588.1 hypothetical protein SAMN04487818_117112 [Actinokineospora terrae]
MTSSRVLTLFASGLALCAACSAGPSGEPPRQDPAVGWVDRVCQAVVINGARLSQLPAIDPTDPVKAKEGMLAFLTSLSDSLTAVGDGITNAGTPPVTDGAAAVGKAMANLDGARTSVDSAKTTLAAAPATDPVAFQQAVDALAPNLGALQDNQGPVRDLRENPEINDAYHQAPTCHTLDGVS